jgi:Ca2+-binding EF-hand superfamily protein
LSFYLTYKIRETFLKLLRPGMDYRQVFVDYVQRTVMDRQINKFKDEKDYYRLRPDAQEELDEEIEAMQKEMLSTAALSKDDMSKLLRQMGMAMKETELRALIDAFDVDGDGVITIQEFLSFMGPKRDKKAGSSVVMSQRCCWLTTCKVTGMPGAYSVSAPTKRSKQAEMTKLLEEKRAARFGATAPTAGSSKKSKNRDDEYEDDDHEYDDDDKRDNKNKHGATSESNAKLNASGTGTVGNINIVTRKLANGESRLCIELRERRKREDLLRRMGLIGGNGGTGGGGAARREASAKGRDDDDNYEDDFGDDKNGPYADDFDDDDNHNTKGKSPPKKAGQENCDYANWRAEDRKKGLKFMLDISKEAREEETIKSLMASGIPPAPPKLWVQNEHFIETKSLNRSSTKGSISRGDRDGDDEDEDEGGNLGPESTEITVFWGPHKGDLVSFYSLEYGGVVGATKTSDVKYTEIFRDPADADPGRAFEFCYTMRDLTPGASYRFRIRAFNGFGAGDYTYKIFTTVTAAPTKPRVIKVTSDSVSLKWTFSQGFFRRIEELRRIFVMADSDRSGNVSREELTAVLDEKASSSPELRAFLNKAAVGLGLDVAQGYGALFDMIEGDDDGGLSWAEFEAFFMSAVSAVE